jgi:hypothetical protein
MKQWAARAVMWSSVAALGASAVGCSSAPDRSEGRYCTEVGNHLGVLNTPSLRNGDDITAMLVAWRIVADAAPLAVQKEWDTVIGAITTAAGVNSADPTSLQRVADAARASEPAANRIISYTFQKCGATIGAVAPVLTTPTGSTVAPTSPPTAPPSAAPSSAAPGSTQTAGASTTDGGATPTITVVITTTTAG